MLRLSSLVVLTVVAFGVAALVASALVANLASARTAGHFRVLSPVAATPATTAGEVKTQRQFAEAQQLRPTIADTVKATGSTAGGIVRKCPPC